MWMLNSTVSSRLLKSMATVEGFQHEVCETFIENELLYEMSLSLEYFHTGDFDWLQMDGEQIM